MAEELKALIDKINEEAVQAAESKAKSIENAAKNKAREIIDHAKRQAQSILEDAKKEIEKTETSAKSSIKQAGRDLVLSLRKEINTILERISVSAVNKALTPEEMIRIISSLMKECRSKEECSVVIVLNKEDLAKVEKGLLAELAQEVKKGLTLKASDDIRGGFTISYDKSKSHYDFTDEALAGYLAGYLRPKLKELLKG